MVVIKRDCHLTAAYGLGATSAGFEPYHLFKMALEHWLQTTLLEKHTIG
jgi:hypothetical protein